jgi:hypothetical protein
MSMIRRLAAVAFAVALCTSFNIPFDTSVKALPGHEIDTTYYDACREEIFFRVIDCNGFVSTYGTSSAGAVYKDIMQIPCDSGQMVDTWYQSNGSGGWTIIPGPPPGC